MSEAVLTGTPTAPSEPNATPEKTASSPAASWRDSLPDDLKNEASLNIIQDIPNLAKAYVNAQKMIGADKIVVPGKHATDEDWAKVFQKLGLPESVDKYEVKAKEGSPLDEGFFKAFKEQAHKAGVLPGQAQKLMDWYNTMAAERMTEVQTQQKAEMEKGVSSLKTEWGQAWDRKVAAANVAVQEFGGDDFKEFLETSGLGNHPMMIKLMAKVGESLSEDKIKGLKDVNFGKTPDEIKKEISTVMGDRNHPYWNKSHPNHKLAVDEMQKLYNQMSAS